MRKGIAVSPGVAVGTAYCISEIYVNPDTKRLEDREVTAELARYETARDKTAKDLKALQTKVTSQVGAEEAAIFAVHQSILRDSAFTNRIRNWIVEDRLSAQAALHQLLEQYAQLFAKTSDEYLRERVNDVRDVVIRISAYLTDVILDKEQCGLSGPLIVVADEIMPSQAVALGGVEVRGIVTQAGSQTSHAAILARSRGIPAVSGVPGILKHVKTGDTIIVDGRAGTVIINPDAEQRSAYLKLEREFFLLKDQLATNRDHPAVTADNVPLELFANINNAADAKAAVAMGSSGVGLFRTEYIYLTHPNVPDEEEQFAAYSEIIAASPPGSITIRTLDIGGDKTVPYLGHTHQEANPFMGWRSIRLSFEHPEFFSTQIRAILRAAGACGEHHQVRMMFPMVTTLEEVKRLRGMVRKAAMQLRDEKRPYKTVPLGIMVEVPAAAISIQDFLNVVDFVSIGSNDLVQYLMAADRDNPKVSHLCQPLAPPVLRVLSKVIRAAVQAKKPVTLCGEMAGQPRAFLMLFGLGLRSFSMSPAFIPTMKELASHLTEEEARKITRQAMTYRTTQQVKRYLAEQLERIAPKIATLDTA